MGDGNCVCRQFIGAIMVMSRSLMTDSNGTKKADLTMHCTVMLLALTANKDFALDSCN